ncbi:MAG: right-handed parallel beta-helix repeat-containing protein, partial [Actinobacteria bacterium]|nr:right-handed parallel beta-helix repeat-containing protein [Actinomycetota bacterium]
MAIYGGSGNTIQNMTVQNNVNDYLGAPCDLGDGIILLNSDDNRILDNRLVGNGPFGGISLVEDSDRNLISGNVVLGHNLRSRSGSGCGNANQDEGIRIEGPGANDNIVENNRVEGSGLAGIGLHGHVCNPGPGEEATDPNSGNIIRRNTVLNNEQDGISFLQQGPASIVCPSFGNTIERNVSSNNGGDGIFVAANSHDNTISHNVVSNNAGAGIRLNDPRFNNVFTNVGPTLFDLVQPDRAPYVEGTDYRVMSGSGSGDVTARVVPIDINFVDANNDGINDNPVDTSTSGCEQADYTAAGFQAGDIALIQRGTCTFVSKVNLAIANGASAVIMFNEGQAGRTTFAFGAVGPVPIPVLSTTFAVGRELYNLAQAGTVTAHVVTNTTNVQTLAAPAPYNNILIGNQGSGNAEVDGYDGNLEPPCDNNKWRASRFVTVNQPCVVGPGGSGNVK